MSDVSTKEELCSYIEGAYKLIYDLEDLEIKGGEAEDLREILVTLRDYLTKIDVFILESGLLPSAQRSTGLFSYQIAALSLTISQLAGRQMDKHEVARWAADVHLYALIENAKTALIFLRKMLCLKTR